MRRVPSGPAGLASSLARAALASVCGAASASSTAAAAGSGAGSGSAGGTMRICASQLVDFDDMPALALPAGLIFTEWGSQAGDLRALRLDPDYPPARGAGAQSAVVLGADVTLTASAPCAVAPARALVSPSHDWRTAVVPAGQAVFLATDTLGPDGPRALAVEQRALYEVLTMNVLTARVESPAGDATTVR